MKCSRALLVALTAVFLGCGGAGDTTGKATLHPSAAGALIITYFPSRADTFAVIGSDSSTVLERLRRRCDASGIVLATKEYSFGVLVEKLGTRANGESGYWLYNVNSKMVPKGAGDCRVGVSDTVNFFFDER